MRHEGMERILHLFSQFITTCFAVPRKRMIIKVFSCTTIGIESCLIDVEVDVSPGLPQFFTVGLPDIAVKESKDRIRAAMKNSGYGYPRHHITVNLAPADVRKEGTAFDLPIAVGLAATEGLIQQETLQDYIIMGELSLDGRVKAVQGVLPAAFLAKETGYKGIIIPHENVLEATMVKEINVIPVKNLPDVIAFFRGEQPFTAPQIDPEDLFFQRDPSPILDFSEIKGQEQAKRAFEIAAAGMHNLIMIGPPGAGKTMLAQRMPTILPEWSFQEAIETTKIYSVAGLLDKEQMIVRTRPFRSPHHTISDAGLVGGGHIPKPGEISLAHHGILFLDEFPEFKKNALESLRQPLESGVITISRSSSTATFPARFMLLGAMNPCPCGYYGDTQRSCRCSMTQIRQYQAKISGPLLDRIDIHIEIPSLRYRDLTSQAEAESSRQIRERVKRARFIQAERLKDVHPPVNAQMSAPDIKKFCVIDEASHKLLEMAVDKLGMSARTFTRILKIARTIADLEEERDIQSRHIAEAVQYRDLDRRII